MKKETHIHFIGICGVAMSALAVAFHKKGYKVTGSDKGFYPPVSVHLKEAGVTYYPGWHPEKMTRDGAPDLVIVGNVAGSKNPEWLYVKENNIPYVSYPEAIAEHFVKKNSIVCTGTYGKTTCTTLLTWMLKEEKFHPTYMFGGISMNDMESAEITSSEWSILEGDEYKSSRWDMRPKFAHYSPTHLLLTSVVWDHADVYPTKQSYIDAFKKLTKNVDDNGFIVLSEKVDKDIVALEGSRIITYGQSNKNDYQYDNIQINNSGISFDIIHEKETFHIETNQIGEYMADNMTGCFAMGRSIGIEPKRMVQTLQSFKGVKRRLEKRFEGGITIFDDIAHSPSKAQAVIASLRKVYRGQVVAVFEPNTGNRQEESIPGYMNKFQNADMVIIPRLTQIKQSPNMPSVFDGDTLKKIIAETHKNVVHIENDNELVHTIIDLTKKDDVVVFLGSHGFRGMIEELVKKAGS